MPRHPRSLARSPQRLLTRILESRDPQALVRSLEPKQLLGLVRHVGLEDCGEIVALATADQLTPVLDDDLWPAPATGTEEQLDTDRFVQWLEVLSEAGLGVAARTVAALDFDLVTSAVTRHLLVVHPDILLEAAAALTPDDSEPVPWDEFRESLPGDSSDEIGGYTIVARGGGGWDTLAPVLRRLADENPGVFARLMARCAQVSTEHIEFNGGAFQVLTAREQVLEDAASNREERRDQQGHVAPARAAVFLAECRRTPPPPATEGGARPFTALQPAEGARLPWIRARLEYVAEHDPAAHAQRRQELVHLANVLVSACSFRERRFTPAEAMEAALAALNLGLESWARPDLPDADRVPPDLLVRQDLPGVFRRGLGVLHHEVTLSVARETVAALADLRIDDDELNEELRSLARGLEAQIKSGTPWREIQKLDILAVLDPPTSAILAGLLDECPVVPKPQAPSGDGRNPPLRVATEFEFISDMSRVAWARDFARSLPSRLLGG